MWLWMSALTCVLATTAALPSTPHNDLEIRTTKPQDQLQTTSDTINRRQFNPAAVSGLVAVKPTLTRCPLPLTRHGTYCSSRSPDEFYSICYPTSMRHSFPWRSWGKCPADHVCQAHDPYFRESLFVRFFWWAQEARVVCVPSGEKPPSRPLAEISVQGWQEGLRSGRAHEHHRAIEMGASGQPPIGVDFDGVEQFYEYAIAESSRRGGMLAGGVYLDSPGSTASSSAQGAGASTGHAHAHDEGHKRARASRGIVIRDNVPGGSFAATVRRAHTHSHSHSHSHAQGATDAVASTGSTAYHSAASTSSTAYHSMQSDFSLTGSSEDGTPLCSSSTPDKGKSTFHPGHGYSADIDEIAPAEADENVEGFETESFVTSLPSDADADADADAEADAALEQSLSLFCEPLNDHEFRAGDLVTVTLDAPEGQLPADTYLVWSILGPPQ